MMAFLFGKQEIIGFYDPEEYSQLAKDASEIIKKTKNIQDLPPNLISGPEFNALVMHNTLRKYNPNTGQLRNDMLFLISMALSYGTNMLSETYTPLAPEVQARLKHLIDLYHIEKRLPLNSTKETVTLRRILRSFPDFAYFVLQTNPNLPRTIQSETMAEYGYKDFPACFGGDFIFSLIPFKEDGKNFTGLVKAALHYQFEEIEALNYDLYQSGKLDTETIMLKILDYATRAWTESHIHPTERKQLIQQSGVDQATMDSWSSRFDAIFFAYKHVGFQFGQGVNF